MKGTSDLIMGLTLVLVVSLAVVLGLVLVLLAELYCSILTRRRLLRVNTPTAVSPTTFHNSPSSSQGVLAAPTTFLDPKFSGDDIEKQHSQPPENVDSGTTQKDLSSKEVDLVYISNPIYENRRPSRVDDNTPFETPDTSPSRLETGDSSEDDEREEVSPSSICPLKKAVITPAEGCSVSRSLGTDSNGVSSSSSLLTPCTSPSW